MFERLGDEEPGLVTRVAPFGLRHLHQGGHLIRGEPDVNLPHGCDSLLRASGSIGPSNHVAGLVRP